MDSKSAQRLIGSREDETDDSEIKSLWLAPALPLKRIAPAFNWSHSSPGKIGLPKSVLFWQGNPCSLIRVNPKPQTNPHEQNRHNQRQRYWSGSRHHGAG